MTRFTWMALGAAGLAAITFFVYASPATAATPTLRKATAKDLEAFARSIGNPVAIFPNQNKFPVYAKAILSMGHGAKFLATDTRTWYAIGMQDYVPDADLNRQFAAWLSAHGLD